MLRPRLLTLLSLVTFVLGLLATLFVFAEDRIFDAVWSREQVMHTALPHGLAVPHARLPELGKPHVFIARCREGIDFDAADGSLAQLICLILTPTEQPDTQIEMLSLIVSGKNCARMRGIDISPAASISTRTRFAAVRCRVK